jgi:uncharacterized membrane protein
VSAAKVRVLHKLASVEPVTAGQRKGGTGRLLGVDAARALALIGMMSVHLLPSTDPDGTISTAYFISSGRASALFAVLAGVGLALANGGMKPPRGRAHFAAAAGIAGRAVVLAMIGLYLGDLDSGVAVILVNYAFLFLVSTAFLGMSGASLGALAVTWAVAAPVIAFWLRLHLPDSSAGDPGIDLIGFLQDIFLTGYYPVFPWIAYLLAGLAVGRSNLGDRKVAGALVGVGVALALASKAISGVLLDSFAPTGMKAPVQFFGTTPTDTWWYLAVSTPHSGTTFDLLHTIGTSLAILGVCLLLAAAGRFVLGWLAAAGGMTLTLYTSHVLALTEGWGLNDRPALLVWHVVAAIVIGLFWRTFVGRGPLEVLAASLANAFKSAVPRASTTPRGA